jgi:nucleoside-diphosphate-sugar epimerase
MTTLVVGASGATGRLLVLQLLEKREKVRVIVRSAERFSNLVQDNPNLTVLEANVLDLSEGELTEYVKDCDAVASCLGHNLTFKGLYGQPRRLVTDATRQLCQAIKSTHPSKAVKYILMNTTGNSNRDLDEKISFGQKVVVGLLRRLLPPHVDNEQAADYLRTEIGQDDKEIKWAAVRPDGLIDEDTVSDYELHASPLRDPIFDSGKTSRINVANFMMRLVLENDTWDQWKGQMPVIYNKTSS